ncbi:MAG: AMP-binding protein, partial [Chloroflexi bacterium]|nr:AMP-binding protein [Chloroflexota bacterium]
MGRLSEPVTDLSRPLTDSAGIPAGSSSSPTRHSRKSTRRFVRPGMSHVKGDTTTPLLELSIPELVNDTVRNYSKRTAVVFCGQGIRKTWQEFAADIDRLAAGFLALGLKKGDRLGIWSPNRYEWLLTQFATARTGVILVTINPAYKISELKHVLETAGCKAIIMAQQFKSSNYVEMFLQLKVNVSTSEFSEAGLPKLKHAIIIHNQDRHETPAGMHA